jgi:micrococcal nuclease
MIGIDTPESRANNKAYKDAYRSKRDIETIVALGKASTNYTKSLVKKGDTVSVEFDVEKRDQYKRLLGYVYLKDGRMLNEEIVKAGYASLLTMPPNVKYVDRFKRLYKEARDNNRGLWKS